MPHRVEVHHGPPVGAGLVLVPAGAGGEDGRLEVGDRVNVEVEVYLRRHGAVGPGRRAEVGTVTEPSVRGAAKW